MSIFCAVDDAALIRFFLHARKRIVFIAPGVHDPVALALEKPLQDVAGLGVTVILDPDEDVCRIGYGDAAGLKVVNECAKKSGF